jgi:hypothetical protein
MNDPVPGRSPQDCVLGPDPAREENRRGRNVEMSLSSRPARRRKAEARKDGDEGRGKQGQACDAGIS